MRMRRSTADAVFVTCRIELLAQIGAEQAFFEDHAVAVSMVTRLGLSASASRQASATASWSGRITARAFSPSLVTLQWPSPGVPDRHAVPAYVPLPALALARQRDGESRVPVPGTVQKKARDQPVPDKYAGGKPATGRLCRTGPRIIRARSGARPVSHRCDNSKNATARSEIPLLRDFRRKVSSAASAHRLASAQAHRAAALAGKAG